MRQPAGTELSLVIPTYNEGTRITETVHRVTSYLEGRGFDYEIIIVDDGSRDDTLPKLERLSRSHPRLRVIGNGTNRGKGFTVRRGVLAASKAYILYADADLSVPIEESEKLLKKLADGFDIAIGSKALADSKVIGQPLHRRMMGKVLNLLVRLLLFEGIHDTQCGFKCFKQKIAQDLFTSQQLDGFSFEIEVLHLARKKGYQISEVPVACIHRPGSTVRPLRDSIVILVDLLKIRSRRP